jgi:hypothetical protein
MTSRRIVLCDIDHVIADSFWRDSMIGGEGGWDAYHEAAKDDKPVLDMVALLRALSRSGFEVHGLTARPEKWRAMTLRWLVNSQAAMEGLLMRGDKDFRPSPLVKIDLMKTTWPDYKERVAFLIEDRDDVCALFRAEGIIALQCHISAGTAPSVPFHLENEHGKPIK